MAPTDWELGGFVFLGGSIRGGNDRAEGGCALSTADGLLGEA
jgi:hypothetical protein